MQRIHCKWKIAKPEHAVHGFQVFVIQEPNVAVLVVLVKGDREAVGNIQDTLA